MRKIFLPRRHKTTNVCGKQDTSFYNRSCLRAFVAILIWFTPMFLFSQEVTQSLNSNWQFSESGKNEWLNATVPGTVHTDLLQNGKIPDPYTGTNESKVQWVETKTWEYKSTFNADDNLWKCKHKELIFEGLDTYADVYLNDKLILTSTDMFVPCRTDVDAILKKENNILRIVFHPASELIAKNKAESEIKNLPGGDRVFIRKAQYQFGWDFGPRLVTCGIWKPVQLRGTGDLDIMDITFKTDSIKSDTAYLTCVLAYINFADDPKIYDFTVSDTKNVYLKKKFKLSQNQHGINYQIKIAHPHLWWCNQMGKPYLYRFNCTLNSGPFHYATTVVQGVRTIELKKIKDDAGESFTFYLNGQPVFIKGANWIPADNFTPRVTSQSYYSLIKSAQESNMNMLRVWGGGIYENDQFYNNCDSLGILVWQDFMFAGGMYPSKGKFHDDVLDECMIQYLRLNRHPSIAIWCGNNEIEEGWNNWDWQKENKINKKDSATIFHNYLDIFDTLIPQFILRNKVNYIRSSPSIGWGHPEAYKSGDVHYWGVWWNSDPISAYDNHVGRFMSEYGLQSLPQLSSFKTFDTDPAISNTDSTFQSHQKNAEGFAKINLYMQNDYPVATDFSDFKNDSDFSDYIYISQVMQRDGISRAIQDHRRAEPYCMGTLLWQYNDCWPATSWSSTDYYGQQKLVQYALKDLYAPVLVSVTERNDSVLLYVVNDDTIRHVGILGFQWFSFDGVNARTSIAQTTVYAGRSMMILGFPKSMLFDELKPKNGVLNVVFSYEGDKSVSTKYYFVKTKELALAKDPGIVTDIVANVNKAGSYIITLRTISLAKSVCLSINDPNTKFSDNGFDLMAGETKDIVITTSLSLEDLKKRLRIQMMNNFSQ